MMPSDTWLKPILTSSAAMRMSAAIATSAPPPSACPLRAATTGNGEVGDAVEEPAHAARHVDGLLVGADRAELLEVPTRDERTVAAAPQHEHRGVGAEDVVERSVELVDRGEADRVADLGPVDVDDGDPRLHLDPHPIWPHPI